MLGIRRFLLESSSGLDSAPGAAGFGRPRTNSTVIRPWFERECVPLRRCLSKHSACSRRSRARVGRERPVKVDVPALPGDTLVIERSDPIREPPDSGSVRRLGVSSLTRPGDAHLGARGGHMVERPVKDATVAADAELRRLSAPPNKWPIRLTHLSTFASRTSLRRSIVVKGRFLAIIKCSDAAEVPKSSIRRAKR